MLPYSGNACPRFFNISIGIGPDEGSNIEMLETRLAILELRVNAFEATKEMKLVIIYVSFEVTLNHASKFDETIERHGRNYLQCTGKLLTHWTSS